jgi:hypothetical protein
MPKWVYSGGKGGIDVPDEGTPYGWCDYCGVALHFESDGRSEHIKCRGGHFFEQIYNWGGYNDEHGRLARARGEVKT